MKLKDIYNNQVAGTGPVGPAQTTSNSYMPIKERDPKSIELENKISEKMNQAIVGQQPKTNNQKPLQPINAVAEVSFEQALKELSDLTKNKT